MEDLIGKVIKKIEIDSISYGNEIVFTTDTGERIGYYTDGDCCSQSWISHLSGVNSLLGNKVVSVDDSKHILSVGQAEDEMEKDGQSFESLAIYGYDIKTEKGICTLEFRNDSNGYYGGSLEKMNKETKKLQEVAEDF